MSEPTEAEIEAALKRYTRDGRESPTEAMKAALIAAARVRANANQTGGDDEPNPRLPE